MCGEPAPGPALRLEATFDSSFYSRCPLRHRRGGAKTLGGHHQPYQVRNQLSGSRRIAPEYSSGGYVCEVPCIEEHTYAVSHLISRMDRRRYSAYMRTTRPVEEAATRSERRQRSTHRQRLEAAPSAGVEEKQKRSRVREEERKASRASGRKTEQAPPGSETRERKVRDDRRKKTREARTRRFRANAPWRGSFSRKQMSWLEIEPE